MFLLNLPTTAWLSCWTARTGNTVIRRKDGNNAEIFDPRCKRREHRGTNQPYRPRQPVPNQRGGGEHRVVGKGAGEAWPELPKGIQDRPAEIWEPLIAVADVAGGDWPEKSRKACVALCRDAEDRGVSLGLRLLSDIRILFGDDYDDPEVLAKMLEQAADWVRRGVIAGIQTPPDFLGSAPF